MVRGFIPHFINVGMAAGLPAKIRAAQIIVFEKIFVRQRRLAGVKRFLRFLRQEFLPAMIPLQTHIKNDRNQQAGHESNVQRMTQRF